jgi:hypothetical protein
VTTTSQRNWARYCIASSTTWATASGSSPFTWKMGHSSILATSVGYGVERASFGLAVKPIWLLTMTWNVPPVR